MEESKPNLGWSAPHIPSGVLYTPLMKLSKHSARPALTELFLSWSTHCLFCLSHCAPKEGTELCRRACPQWLFVSSHYSCLWFQKRGHLGRHPEKRWHLSWELRIRMIHPHKEERWLSKAVVHLPTLCRVLCEAQGIQWWTKAHMRPDFLELTVQ